MKTIKRMQAKLQWIEQLSDEPAKCARCRKKIQPLEPYFRLSQAMDGGDEFGKDHCHICKEAVVAEGAA